LRGDAAVILIAVGFSIVACTSKGSTATEEQLCTPGAYVFCRCQDRTEGSKACSDDGLSFGDCLPCDATGPSGDGGGGARDVYEPPNDARSTGDTSLPPGDSSTADTTGGGLCGNGTVDPGEGCDDGNANGPADACSATCVPNGNIASLCGCPGTAVHVWGPELDFTGSTGNCSNTTSANGCSSAGKSDSDRAFNVTAHKTGTMTVTVANSVFDPVLYARTTCSDLTTEIACKDEGYSNATLTLSFQVTSGAAYTVFVDGYGTLSGGKGTFTIGFAIQ
jgi:cysteine-rich repeat protein